MSTLAAQREDTACVRAKTTRELDHSFRHLLSTLMYILVIPIDAYSILETPNSSFPEANSDVRLHAHVYS